MKRSICFFLAVIMLLGAVLPSYSAYVEAAEKFDRNKHQYLELIKENDWSPVSGVERIQTRKTGIRNILYVSSNGDNVPLSVEYDPAKEFSLEGYNELGFDISVNGGEGSVTYKLTYYGVNGTYTDEVNGGDLQRSFVRFKIPEDIGPTFDRMVFSVEHEGAPPLSCTVLGIYGDDFRTYSYAERFSSLRVETLDGVSTYYDDRIEIVPDENGSHLRCHLMDSMNGATAMVTLRVYSPFAGVMTVENGGSGKATSTAMYSGEAVYTFAVSGVWDTLKIGFAESVAGGAAVQFLSMDILHIWDKDPVTYGAVDSCVYDEGKISVKGTVSSDAVVKYIDAKLALYKLPYDSNDYSGLTESECEMSISTAFTMTADAEYDHTQYKYLVALKTEDEVIPLCAPVFSVANTSMPSVSPDCIMAVHRVESATVFESRAENVFVDVYANELYNTDASTYSVRYPFCDGIYEFDRNKVNALEKEIEFYISVGCKVYLNIVGGASGSSEDVNRYCALVSFAGERFGDASGVIVSCGTEDKANVKNAAEKFSRLIGRLRAVLSTAAPSTELFVSYEDGMEETAALVSYYNNRNGINDVSLVYKSGDGENAVAKAKAVSDSSHRMGCPYRQNSVLFSVDEMNEVEKFFDVYAMAQRNGLSFAVFSKGESVTDEYARNTLMHRSETGFEIYELSADTDEEGCSYASVWDFKDSYDTFGWLAGGGCSTPETVKYMLGEGRAMRTHITPHKNGEGILVCWLDGIKDISKAEKMKLTYGFSSEDNRDIPLRVVLGAGGAKAEYKSAAVNGEGQIVLDLEMFPRRDKLEYVAIIIESSVDAVLDVTDISIGSSETDAKELMEVISPKEENKKDMASVYIFAGATVWVTVLVFALLTKKKKTPAVKKP